MEVNKCRCIVWGGYGGGNAGDELTLAIALRDMNVRFGGGVVILSPVPGYTMALFPGERVVGYRALSGSAPTPLQRSIPERAWLKCRRSFGIPDPVLARKSISERVASEETMEWVNLIKGADLLYLVGGGYLTDLFDLEGFLAPVEVARYHGVKVETAPLGIGPFTLEESRTCFGSALEGISVRVRDPESLAECRALGIAAEKHRDDGFRVKEEIDFADVRARNVIGVNYFPQHGAIDEAKAREWWRDLVIGMRQEGVEFEGFCFHNQISCDFSKMVELFTEAGVPPERTCAPSLDFRSACRRVASYRGIVTCRFHAAVVANAVGLPTLASAAGPYYSSKMAEAVEGSESAQVIDPLTTSVDDALSIIRDWSMV